MNKILESIRKSANWGGRSLNLWLAAILVLASFTMIGPRPAPAIARVQPLLLHMAAEQPDQTVAVIVQKAAKDARAEDMVSVLGGKVTKDLHIINAFAAEMKASAARQLATSSAVRWVSLDAAVESVSVSPQTLRDEFNTVSFNSNDGTQTWASPWLEDDSAGAGASAGEVWVEGGGLRLHATAGSGALPGATREADLGHAMSGPSLVFGFRFGPGVLAGQDAVVLEISADGGQTYKKIITFGSYNGGTSGTFYGGIADYVSSHTRIRFRVVSGYDGPGDYFSLDYVEIAYDANPLSSGVAYNTYLDTLNVRQVWSMGYRGEGIGVAVIDSGVNKQADFGRRIKKQMSFNPNSSTVNDVYGHGTHVAGIVGGEDVGHAGRFNGIAPGVQLISLKINDENGMAYESDMVKAMQWVLDNKNRFNIRVVNLSVNSTAESSYHTSPLDAAAEILWFNGVVVVASAGNKTGGNGSDTANAAPANDPFIITVGASDERGTASRADDAVAPFSAYGITLDGFAKPDIVAPGKDVISALSSQSAWYANHPQRVVLENYFRLSGTSMAAPMVTGAVALLLQDEPNLTPDQVKYRLLNTGSTIQGSSTDTRTYPYLNVYAVVTGSTTQSANTGIVASQLLWTGSQPVTWGSVNWNSVNWNSVNWNSVNWNSVNWNSVNWNSAYWGP